MSLWMTGYPRPSSAAASHPQPARGAMGWNRASIVIFPRFSWRPSHFVHRTRHVPGCPRVAPLAAF
jgi:hypothetical protein